MCMTTSTASSEPATTHAAPWRSWAGLTVLALPTLLLSLDITVLHLAVPHLSADLHPTASQSLWIIDIYGFLLASLLITMGAVGDRWGRRRLLLTGALGFAAASTAAALAPSAEALIAARALMGVTGAAILPSTLSLISSLFPDARRRGTAIGIWAAMFSLGIALGPLLGGLVLERFWWGAVFLLGLPIMALLLLAGPSLLPAPATNRHSRLRPSSVLLLMGTLLAATYALKECATQGASGTAVAVALLAMSLGTAFVRRQRSAADPLLDLGLLAEPRIRTTLLTVLVSVGAVGGIYLFVTQFLQLVAGLAPLAAGLTLLPAALVLVATSAAAPTVASRTGPGAVLAASLMVSALGFAVLATTSVDSSLSWVVGGFAVVYAGVGPVMALGTDLVVGAAPESRAGAAAGLSETSSELGISLGVATLGSIGAAVFAARTLGELPAGVDTLSAVHERAAATSGVDLLEPARVAFVEGMNLAALVAVVTLSVTAVAAGWVLRARDEPRS